MITKTVSTTGANRKLWLAAIKPPMYSVAIMPIWVGTAVAFYQTQTLNWSIFTTFLSSAILILAWENILNDVFDSETGIDQNKAHSLVNLTGNKSLIFALGNGCLILGILGILAISWWQQDGTVLALITLCCFLGYLYQGPPFRLGYQGLGEFLCFFAFGPVGMAAAYYSQTQQISSLNFMAAVIIGLATTLILFCSHFHQVEDDQKAGKKSPIVRLGTQRGAQLLPWWCGLQFIMILGFVALGWFPQWTLLSLVGLPDAIKLCIHVHRHHHQPSMVSNCKFIAVATHFWVGLFLGLGFMLG